MQVNIPAKARAAIYIITAVTSPTMFYLNEQAVVDNFWFGLYSVFVTAVTALAFSNVTPDQG